MRDGGSVGAASLSADVADQTFQMVFEALSKVSGLGCSYCMIPTGWGKAYGLGCDF